MASIFNQIPIQLDAAYWYWDKTKSVVVETPNPYFELKLLYPRPLSDYDGNPKDGYNPDPKATRHSVLIVGYLKGQDNNDFWIIKNSHSDQIVPDDAPREDLLYLVRTPGSSGDIQLDESTKRNFFLNGINTYINTFLGAKFYQL